MPYRGTYTNLGRYINIIFIVHILYYIDTYREVPILKVFSDHHNSFKKDRKRNIRQIDSKKFKNIVPIKLNKTTTSNHIRICVRINLKYMTY